jgi:hypothetical protein
MIFLSQTLTTLDLQFCCIRDAKARSLSEALKINQVRDDLSFLVVHSTFLSLSFTDTHQSHSTGQQHQDWRGTSIEWSSEDKSSETRSPLSHTAFNVTISVTDIDHIRSPVQLDRWWRSTVPRWSLEGQSSETWSLSSNKPSNITRSITDTQLVESFEKQYHRYRSTAIGWSVTDQSSERLFLLPPSAFSITLYLSQTLTKLDLGGNNISADGAQALYRALTINKVRDDLSLCSNKSFNILLSITDTHFAESCEQQYLHWRGTVIGWSFEDQSG